MTTTVFLGAGASAAEGAPVQSTLFREYFKAARNRSPDYHNMDRELTTFFDRLFGIDVDKDDLVQVNFPTFEEALGLLDLAEQRRESFKDYPLESITADTNKIRQVRIYLIFCMAKAIADSLHTSNGIHSKLVRNLDSEDLLKETCFISTNYDILIDNALAQFFGSRVHRNIDYGLQFTNPSRTRTWNSPLPSAVKLLKVHGSLNWLYCPTCNDLALTPCEKGAITLTQIQGKEICWRCQSLFVPIIVPPTYFKDLTNVHIGSIWNYTEQILRDVKRIIFCGYSFPDADINIKYLLKRIETNRNSAFEVKVVNWHQGKKDNQASEEKARFNRFFIRDVEYTNMSFADFADNPKKLL